MPTPVVADADEHGELGSVQDLVGQGLLQLGG